MKLKTLIIDDEPIALEKLNNYVSKVAFLELVGACRSGIEGTDLISRQEVDVVFTDINMPDMNGLDFIASLPSPPLVVFITAYAEYAVESYRFSATDYLLKPYGFADFQRAANKVLEQYRLRQAMLSRQEDAASADMPGDCIFVKVDYRYIRVNIADIRYIKGYGEYLQIYLRNASSPLLTLSSFGSIRKRLPSNFLQVHRSFVVNMNAIESVGKSRIVMDRDTDIPIGDSYKDAFQEYLLTHSIGSNQRK